ncbi:hypothetical protein SprV_0100308200 [Sparganum proliferum]
MSEQGDLHMRLQSLKTSGCALSYITGMESNELTKQTRKLLLARRTLFRNTGFDALHNRYLHSHSLLNLRTGCCVDVCPGCFRSLSDADLMYKVRLAKPEVNKNDPSAVIETFRCRFCNGQMRTRTRLSKRLPETKSQPNLATSVNPFDVVSPATPIAAAKGGGLRNLTGCSGGSGKKARRQQKLCKELKLRPSGGKESRNSLEDFLNLLS